MLEISSGVMAPESVPWERRGGPVGGVGGSAGRLLGGGLMRGVPSKSGFTSRDARLLMATLWVPMPDEDMG